MLIKLGELWKYSLHLSFYILERIWVNTEMLRQQKWKKGKAILSNDVKMLSSTNICCSNGIFDCRRAATIPFSCDGVRKRTAWPVWFIRAVRPTLQQRNSRFREMKDKEAEIAFLLYRFFGRKKFRNEKIRNRFNRIEIKTPMITCECSPQPMLDNQLGSPNLHPKNQGHDSQHQWRSLQRPKQQHQPN